MPAITGCTAGQTARLTYGEPFSTRQIASDIEIVIQPFRDLRRDPDIGLQINLFDGVRYSIGSVNDVGSYVADAMATEFRARGYKASVHDPKTMGEVPQGALVITGDVVEMRAVQPGGMTLEGQTKLFVKMVRDGNEVFEQRVSGSIENVVNEWSVSADVFAATCEKSLRNVFMEFLPKMDQQIELAMARTIGVIEQ
ncbi:MAG TPA: hypothetical protein PL033_04040 [Candidatus Brocadiia bacterium]|nr:hypothetical protein [Candidatus Brocadiia bacterium]